MFGSDIGLARTKKYLSDLCDFLFSVRFISLYLSTWLFDEAYSLETENQYLAEFVDWIYLSMRNYVFSRAVAIKKR